MILDDEGVITNVFAFLDNQDLFKFRRVCKSWNKSLALFILKYNFTSVNQRSNFKNIFKLVIQSCTNLNELRVTGHKRMTNNLLKRLQKLTDLRKLSLHGCIKVGDPGIQEIKNLKNLEELCISKTHVSDAGLKCIALSFSNLQQLDISYCKMSLREIRYLGLLKKLKVLRMDNLTDCKPFYGLYLPALEELYCSENPYNIQISIVQCCPKLRKLDISRRYQRCTTNEFLDILPKVFESMTSLEELNWSRSDLSIYDFSLCAKLTNLKKLILQNCAKYTYDKFHYISTLICLEELDLSFNKIRIEDLGFLSALISLKTLRVGISLNLEDVKQMTSMLTNLKQITAF